MRRPALYALVCFTCGILLGNSFDLPVYLLLSLLCLTLCFCCIFLIRKEPGSASFFLILLLVLAGFFRHEVITRVFPPDHISKFLNLESTVTITGQIVGEPDARANKTFVTLKAENICDGQKVHSTTGRIILKIKESSFKFDHADRIRFKGYLNEPTSKRNPGVFDYKRYLSRKGISGIVTLNGADKVEILGEGSSGFYQSKIVIALRRWIQGVFNKTLSGDHKALLAGFLLGETREISKEVYSMFRDTGTVHLLVVSGSNVWLIVGVILGALTLLRAPKVIATLLSLISILIFANLVNNDPPVVRAGIMAAVVLLGTLLYKDVDLINVVSFAGLVILLCSPLFLFDVGFQLSFVSVFGILFIYPRLSKMLLKLTGKSHRGFWKWVIMPALVSVSVELALFPILAYYFNNVPTIVVLSNVLIVPLAGLSVVLACFTIFSAAFSIGLAGIFSAANWLCLELTLKSTRFFASLPAAKISLPSPSIYTFVLYYLFIWLLIGSAGSKRKAFLFSTLIIANLFFWNQALSRRDQILRASFLDVGSGTATVLEMPNGKTFLVNAGEKEGRFDAGEYIVVPFLNYRGIHNIDGLILTDRSSLNLNSAQSMAEDRNIKTLFAPGSDFITRENNLHLEKPPGSELMFLDSVHAIADTSAQLSMWFLNYPVQGRLGSNHEQIVMKIIYRDFSLCLLDGMKKTNFNPEFDWDQVKNCSVLVLSELGNENDIRQVITAAKPQKIIFTRHYFRYERNKIPLLMQLSFPEIEYYRTARGGAIVCDSRGKEVTVRSTLP